MNLTLWVYLFTVGANGLHPKTKNIKILNGNGGLVPPQLSVPVIKGVQKEGSATQGEEKSDSIVVGDTALDGPGVFVRAPWYEWRLEVHVQGQMRRLDSGLLQLRNFPTALTI